MVSNLSPSLLGVSEARLIPVLVKGFQLQQNKVDELSKASTISNESINLNQALSINNKIVIDKDNNLYANSLELSTDINISGNEFNIKCSSEIGNLISIKTDKTAGSGAQGYLSVKGVYLSDGNVWASNMASKFDVFEVESNISKCNKRSDTGNIGVLVNSEKFYICTGAKGWHRDGGRLE
ncbi:hypothetical protein [Abyssogena phaseoliformis symbiont]|uniref:hypothetical protein n=1 Tax=Abyssogena phaseoliformis symbiont TaxID=596095 RepID=UPI001CED1F62|nr:hypothetical protein [Abyssogena phaseoliformis symbiont]MBW5288675.1 hypothetical protein [Candidatus Ruthia sp. Apha_13_S6]